MYKLTRCRVYLIHRCRYFRKRYLWKVLRKVKHRKRTVHVCRGFTAGHEMNRGHRLLAKRIQKELAQGDVNFKRITDLSAILSSQILHDLIKTIKDKAKILTRPILTRKKCLRKNILNMNSLKMWWIPTLISLCFKDLLRVRCHPMVVWKRLIKTSII